VGSIAGLFLLLALLALLYRRLGGSAKAGKAAKADSGDSFSVQNPLREGRAEKRGELLSEVGVGVGTAVGAGAGASASAAPEAPSYTMPQRDVTTPDISVAMPETPQLSLARPDTPEFSSMVINPLYHDMQPSIATVPSAQSPPRQPPTDRLSVPGSVDDNGAAAYTSNPMWAQRAGEPRRTDSQPPQVAQWTYRTHAQTGTGFWWDPISKEVSLEPVWIAKRSRTTGALYFVMVGASADSAVLEPPAKARIVYAWDRWVEREAG
jgi:hypothetical protein